MTIFVYFLIAVGAFPVFYFLCIYLSLTLFASRCNKLSKSLGGGPYVLIVAHPDDECMFFAPALLSLRDENLHVVSISSGNFDGLGHKRKSELIRSCSCLGISHGRITVMDDKQLQDDPNVLWETDLLAKKLSTHLAMIEPNVVITFDSQGVSGHLNHISTFNAIQYLVRNGCPRSWTAYQLLTVNRFRKYAGVIDIYLSWLLRRQHQETVEVVSSWQQYWTAVEAMKQHRSQFVWFRRLYVMFSRYMVINTLKQII